ncbi:glycosyltransferase family 2 protein [Algihabitans albus]|uniref:glycosyltransferase family 2 protein n=1 Tax=Algihabitans albus TaxID=2164067 RepID=UPI0013C3538C|nr:glycosyltransferase family 2 protein [Algihabitans albus]
MISVICPFYNEAAIIEGATRHMLDQLAQLEEPWELILVDDGSRDGSRDLLQPIAKEFPALRAIGYARNRGRGFALKTGIEAARGDVVVTTEIDCSWGDDIVERLVAELRRRPELDMVIASPNLPGGGYRNVPAKRVWISRLGNALLRIGNSREITMYTGMTRAYRRERFLELVIDEPEKEFHLEVARKAQAFDFKISEIPAVLEWKDHRFAKPESGKRKSSSKIPKLMRTHLVFAIAASPFRYIIPLGLFVAAVSVVLLGAAVINLFNEAPSINLAVLSAVVFLFAFMMIGIGVVAYQGRELQKEIWRLRGEQREIARSLERPTSLVLDSPAQRVTPPRSDGAHTRSADTNG